MPELNFGIGIYVIAVIAVFVFNYLYSRTIITAIKEISEKINVSEQKNKELVKKQNQLEQNQIELKKAKDKAEENDKLKSFFLSNMSHEIRTPMNSILGFTQVLKETKLSDKQFEYINVIENSGKHLLNVIDDILEISKYEANKVKIEETICNLNKLIKEIVLFFELSFKKEKKTNIKINASYVLNNGDELIYTDSKKLRQILINLISNSIKFTLSGSISISYKLTENDELLFSVKDTGIGIEKKQIPIIFERFRQADETTTRKYGGSGLGLAIAKSCTEFLKGKIWVESEIGIGSVFFFTIPYKAVN